MEKKVPGYQSEAVKNIHIIYSCNTSYPFYTINELIISFSFFWNHSQAKCQIFLGMNLLANLATTVL